MVNRLVLTLAIAAVFVVASDAPAGGISDETCPNVRGENTNTCPPGTLGTPYSIRFGEKAIVWMRFVVRTPGGHSAYPHTSPSANKIAIRLARIGHKDPRAGFSLDRFVEGDRAPGSG